MKKMFFSIALLLCSLLGQSQIFVEGVLLDSVHRGEYLIVELSSEISQKCFVKVETDAKIDQKKWNFDWVSESGGKRRGFASRSAAINFLFENGWEVAFVLSSDKLDDPRLLLRRRTGFKT